MSRIDDLDDKAVPITGASTGIGAYVTGNIVHVNRGMFMP